MDSGKLFTGVGTHGNSNTGFFLAQDSKFSLGEKLVWDGTSLTVRGQIRLESGTSVEDAIGAATASVLAEATASNTAKSLSISVDSQVFAFDDSSDNTATPSTITFTVSQQNLTDTILGDSDITITKAGGGQLTTPSLGGVVSNGSGQLSGSIAFADLTNKSDLPLLISVTKDSINDSTSIFKVEGGADGSGSPGSDGTDGTPGSDGTDGTDGVDAVTAFLTNESHTFAASATGVVSTFSGGGTDMQVFEGIVNKTSQYTYSGTGSLGVGFNQSTNTFNVTSMAHDSGSLTITAVSQSVQLVKTMSLAKSKEGVDGTDGTDGTPGTPGTPGSNGLDGSNAKSLVATVDSQVFAFASSSSNVASPTSIIFSKFKWYTPTK